MALFRQLLSFGAVGIFATFAHVAIAYSFVQFLDTNPYFANFLGASVAFCVSFYGNALLTFRTNQSLKYSGYRYIFVSLFSLCATSIIMALVQYYRLPLYVYGLSVLAIVPVSTFLMAKFWAFKSG